MYNSLVPYRYDASGTYLEYDADVCEPLSVLKSREPFGTGGRETERLEALKALPHSMDIGDVQVGQSCVGIVGDILSTPSGLVVYRSQWPMNNTTELSITHARIRLPHA